jgi:KUP system potassium uptake protein
MSQDQTHAAPSPLWILALGALGVVYGDIGTSPLYALRECFHGPHAVEPTPANVLGVLSLVFWALICVISIKYLVFIMRADNRGEGGILALMALVRSEKRVKSKRQWLLVALGLFGAALLYGDGMLTPAISVLSAVEGLEVATTLFQPYVVPITIAILILLFAIQRRGTAGVGAVFGPITLLWFGVLAVLGVSGILRNPTVLRAVDPLHGLYFFLRNGVQGFLVLGGVTLVITGGEALYADMGHFGRRPIRLAWFVVVLPALLLNYFGQGALLINNPEAAHNPFFRLAPDWALYPLVVLATVAACIASQAVISGAFSLTRQAVQLGFSPRVDIVHTSPGEIGQIYIPSVNWMLMMCTIGLVVGFKKSTNLAAAYGIAVTATMVITTLLAFVVERRIWRWSLGLAGAMSAAFLFVDLSFFGANFVKVAQGGWFPLAMAAVVYTLLATWKRGRDILAVRLARTSLPIETFVADVGRRLPARVPGTAIFLNGDERSTPVALLHNLKHNRVLHETNVVVNVQTLEMPHVEPRERLRVESLGGGFWRVVMRYGFMQDPDVPEALAATREHGLELDPRLATYFLSRNSLIPSKRPGMALWRERLFVLMQRNATRATQYFRIPPNRVVELGMQLEI